MIFLSDFVLRNSLIIMSNIVFVKKQRNLFYRQEKSEILYIFVPKHVRGLDPSEKGWWRSCCVYQLVLCELVFKYSVFWIFTNFLRVILRKGAIHMYTTVAQSRQGTASFFSHLDLNKEVSSDSFKFKSARCPTRNRRNMPIKVQMYLMVSNSLDVAEWSRSIGCRKPCFE